METTGIDVHEELESDRIGRWRREELERGGYSAREARLLSRRSEVDLHRALELLEHGCSSKLALRILL